MAKEFLSRKGVPYVEKRVDEDYEAALEMVRVSNQQGVPVIAIDGQVVVGFDRPRIEKLLADAATGKVSFGASVADASTILSRQGQIPVFGAYVGKVGPGSPAERLGLRPGDIIVEMNLRPVSRAEDVSTALAGLRRGDRLAVTWTRGEQRLSGQVSV
jgi:glutaredoxin 3